MLVVGLTGNIASGKTTVSNALKKLGAVIIDADLIAREILLPYSDGWNQIVKTFGKDILTKDDNINREKLGALVFSDEQALHRLNAITHPIIKNITEERLDMLRNSPKSPKMVVIDAALLIEANMHEIADEVWLVKVDKEVQLYRLIKRNNLLEEEALDRINSQIPWEEKVKYATVIIDNTDSVEITETKVKELWESKINSVSSELI